MKFYVRAELLLFKCLLGLLGGMGMKRERDAGAAAAAAWLSEEDTDLSIFSAVCLYFS